LSRFPTFSGPRAAPHLTAREQRPLDVRARAYIASVEHPDRMAKKVLTAQFIERVKPPKSGLVEIIDFRMSYSGQTSWQFLYTWQGKSKRFALGRPILRRRARRLAGCQEGRAGEPPAVNRARHHADGGGQHVRERT
jgi:hypothetical protein